MKTIKVIHPLKHHVYNSIVGIEKFSNEGNFKKTNVEIYLSFYRKKNTISKIIENIKTPIFSSKLSGYQNLQLNPNNISVKNIDTINFLRFQMQKSYHDEFIHRFNKRLKKTIKDGDIIHNLQEYGYETVEYAVNKFNNIKIVSEIIQPVSFQLRDKLEEYSHRWNYPKGISTQIMTDKKIIQTQNLINYSDILIGASNLTSNTLIDLGANSERIKIIPYGSNFEIINVEKKNSNKEKINILYVGSISLLKNIPLMLDVAEKLISDNRIHFNFVGLPKLKDDKKLIDKMIFLDNCTYHGAISHSDLKNVYLKNDIFLFLSEFDGYGMVINEAYSLGLLPIVNSTCRAFFQSTDENVIKSLDLEYLIHFIKQLDHEKIQEVKIKLKKKYSNESISWSKFQDDMAEVYKELYGKYI